MFVVSIVSDVKTLPACIAYKALKATTQNVTWVLGARGRSGEVRHSPLPEFLLFFLRVHLLLPCAQCFLNEGYLKVKCCTVEKLMPKQVGNQNSKSFFASGYFWLVQQTVSFVFVSYNIFWRGCFTSLACCAWGNCLLCSR